MTTMKSTGKAKHLLAAVLCTVIAVCAIQLAAPLGASADPYVPNRSITMSSNDNVNPNLTLKLSATTFATGGPFTVHAKVKLSGLTALGTETNPRCFMQLHLNGSLAPEEQGIWNANTDWTDLKFKNGSDVTFDNLTAASTLNFYFWFAKADFSVADLRIVNAAGQMVYSLANDPALSGKTNLKNASLKTQTIWDCAEYGATNHNTNFTIYTKPIDYTPNRVVTTTVTAQASNDIWNMIEHTRAAFSGKTGLYVVGMMKVEDFAAQAGAAGADIAVHRNGTGYLNRGFENTGGWVPITAADGSKVSLTDWARFGYTNAAGKLSLADIKVVDGTGAIVYDLEADTAIVDGASIVHTSVSVWYMCWQYAGAAASCVASTAGTVTPHDLTDYDLPVYDSGTPVPVPKPWDPVTPLLGAGDPDRALEMVVTDKASSSTSFFLMKEDYETGGPFFITAKVKLTGFEALPSAASSKAYCALVPADAASTEVMTLTADTAGWVTLKSGAYDFVPFENLTADLAIEFGLVGAKGKLYVGDFAITNAKNEVVYSLANDTYLNCGDLTKVSASCPWTTRQPETGVETVFTVFTKGNEDYVPNRVLELTVPDGSTAVNPFMFFDRANALFATGGPFTLHGKIKVDFYGEIPHASERGIFALDTTGGIFRQVYKSTGGWESILDAAGQPFTFTKSDDSAFVMLLGWYANGRVSLADVFITNAAGDKVFDMATDAAFATSSSGSVSSASIWTASAFGAAGPYFMKIYANPAPANHTDSEYDLRIFTANTGLTQAIIDSYLSGDSGGEQEKDKDKDSDKEKDKDEEKTGNSDGTGKEKTGHMLDMAIPLFCLLSAGLLVLLLSGKRKIRL